MRSGTEEAAMMLASGVRIEATRWQVLADGAVAVGAPVSAEPWREGAEGAYFAVLESESGDAQLYASAHQAALALWEQVGDRGLAQALSTLRYAFLFPQGSSLGWAAPRLSRWTAPVTW